jgi:hypothetical protein
MEFGSHVPERTFIEVIPFEFLVLTVAASVK